MFMTMRRFICTLILTNFILLFSCETQAINSLKHFAKRTKFSNYSVTIYENVNAVNKTWVEYKLYLKKTRTTYKNMTGTVLRVGIPLKPHFSPDCYLKQTPNTKFRGYSFQVLEELQNILNFRIKYVTINQTDTIEDLLISGIVDIVVCHPSVKLSNRILQLHPTFKSEYAIIYKGSQLKITKDIFILTFAGTLWLCFLIVLILLAVCLRISTIQYSEIKNKNEYQPWSSVEITLWAIAAACQQGLSYTPNGFTSRCIFYLGYITSYLLYTGFAAAITSVLVQRNPEYHLNVEQLRFSKVNLVSLQDVQHDLHFHQKRITFVKDMKELLDELDADKTVGIVPRLFFDYYASRSFDYQTVGLYAVINIPEVYYSKGFLMKRNNVWYKTFNTWLLRLEETGVLRNTFKSTLTLPVPIQEEKSAYSSAGKEHVGSAVLLFLFGLTAAIVFLLLELAFAFYKARWSQANKK